MLVDSLLDVGAKARARFSQQQFVSVTASKIFLQAEGDTQWANCT